MIADGREKAFSHFFLHTTYTIHGIDTPVCQIGKLSSLLTDIHTQEFYTVFLVCPQKKITQSKPSKKAMQYWLFDTYVCIRLMFTLEQELTKDKGRKEVSDIAILNG